MKHVNIFVRSILIIVIFSTITLSCSKDWFDEKSARNLAVPSSLQDFEYLLDNYDVMGGVSPALGEIASDGHYMTETRWQTLSATGSDNNTQKNAYSWSKTFPYQEVKDWKLNYAKIFQCNLVLYGLSKMSEVSISERERYNEVKGNALFHRAKCFYELAQIYSQPFIEESAGRDIGIPLREGIDITEAPIRSSVKVVYERIFADLKEAAELLSVSPQYLTRGSKLACYGLLARAYLTIGNYQEAVFYADAVLKVNNKLLDFSSIPATNANIGLFNSAVFFHSLITNYSFVFSSGYIFIDQDLYDLYNENDLRKTRFFTKQTAGIVFKGMYNNNILQFSGLATDEMYLIRAECGARLGNVPGAMKDLNDLLRSRWAKNPNGSTKYVDQQISDPLEVLKAVLLERRKELLLRGLRWSDLRRLNRDDRLKITLSRTIDGKTYTLMPDSYKYTFPIPDDERAFSDLEQSPGWDK